MVWGAVSLAFPDTSKTVWQFIVLVGGLVIILPADFLVYEYQDLMKRARMFPVIGMVISGISFVGFSGWYFWSTSKPETTTSKDIQNAQDEPGLFIERTGIVVPVKVPADGRIFVLGLKRLNSGDGSGGIGTVSTSPGSDYMFAGPFSNVSRYTITNYSSKTAIDIIFSLHLVFMEATKINDNVLTSGQVVLDRSWPIHIVKIDPGPANSYVFYVYNLSSDFVKLSSDDHAELHYIGDSKSRVVPILFSGEIPYFPPRMETPK